MGMNVFTFGDSIVRGMTEFLHDSMAWDDVYEPADGTYGYTDSVISYLDECYAVNPDVVYISIGLRECYRSPDEDSDMARTVSSFKENLRTIFDGLLENTSAIIYWGRLGPLTEPDCNSDAPPYRFNVDVDERREAADDVVAEYADNSRIQSIDFYQFVVDEEMPRYDGCHYADEYQKLQADFIAEEVNVSDAPRIDFYGNSQYQKAFKHKAEYIQADYTEEVMVVNLDFATDNKRSDGMDIVFTDGDGTLIPRHIEWFDQTSVTGKVRVRIPSASSETGSDYFYAHWGGSTVNVANDSDALKDVHLLYTMNETTGDILDQSGNSYDGTVDGADLGQGGVHSEGALFADSSDQIYNAVAANFDTTDSFRVRMIFKRTSAETLGGDLFTRMLNGGTYRGIRLSFNNDGTLVFRLVNDSGGGKRCIVDSYLDPFEGTDTCILDVYYNGDADPSNVYFVADGVERSSRSLVDGLATDETIAQGTMPLRVGNRYDVDSHFDGTVYKVEMIAGTRTKNLSITQTKTEHAFPTNGAYTLGDTETKTSAHRSTLNMGMGLSL